MYTTVMKGGAQPTAQVQVRHHKQTLIEEIYNAVLTPPCEWGGPAGTILKPPGSAKCNGNKFTVPTVQQSSTPDIHISESV